MVYIQDAVLPTKITQRPSNQSKQEEAIKHKQDLIEHVVLIIGINEAILQPIYTHDYLVVFHAAKELFVQERCQQVQENVVASDFYEVHDAHDLFQEGQEDHSIVNATKITEEQLGLLSQLENFHVFHDPVATWMEKVSLGVPNIPTFGMPLNCNSNFEFSIIFMLYLSCFFFVFYQSIAYNKF